jgi:hypothetical protein
MAVANSFQVPGGLNYEKATANANLGLFLLWSAKNGSTAIHGDTRFTLDYTAIQFLTVTHDLSATNTHDYTYTLAQAEDGFIFVHHKNAAVFLAVTSLGNAYEIAYTSTTVQTVSLLGNLIDSANS